MSTQDKWHRVQVEYTFGFTYDPRGWCSCGWRGPVRYWTATARRDANKHWRKFEEAEK